MILLSFVLSFIFAASENKCIPEHIKIPFPDMNLEYVRVSPDGKHLIVTDTEKDKVYLYEVVNDGGKYSLRKYETPLRNEAYPVEPDWEFISSPYHDGGTQYFRVSDLIQLQDKATSVYKETALNEFYHSIGGDKDGFTVMSWTRLQSQKYKVVEDKIKAEGELETICPNLMDLPENLRHLKSWMLSDYQKVDEIVSNSDFGGALDMVMKACYAKVTVIAEGCGKLIKTGKGTIVECKENINRRSDICLEQYVTSLKKLIKADTAMSNVTEEDVDNYIKLGNFLTSDEASMHILINPILSNDRKHVAGVYGDSTKVYSIGAGRYCTQENDLKSRTSKVSFSYPTVDGDTKYVTYSDLEYNEETKSDVKVVKVYDLKSNKTYTIATGDSSYSNFTKDERIIYVESDTLNIVDAHKKMYGTCIKDTQSSSSGAGSPASQ